MARNPSTPSAHAIAAATMLDALSTALLDIGHEVEMAREALTGSDPSPLAALGGLSRLPEALSESLDLLRGSIAAINLGCRK